MWKTGLDCKSQIQEVWGWVSSGLVSSHVKGRLPSKLFAISRNEAPDVRAARIQNLRKYIVNEVFWMTTQPDYLKIRGDSMEVIKRC